VKVAYLIRAHHAPSLLERLVRRISGPEAGVFIHVSRTAEDRVYNEMVSRLRDVDRVAWLPRRTCRYGGFSLVEATLSGIDAILADGHRPRHTLLLSGQDYPLRPRADLEAFLEGAGEQSFVHHFHLPSDDWREEDGGLDRIRHIHFERAKVRTRLLRLPVIRRRFPAGYEPYGGSAFWALSTPALEYVHRHVRDNPSFMKFFRHVLIPDEIFFQTILLNSPLRDATINEQLHYVDWSGGGSHPATLGAADLEPMLASGKLFARKFDPADTGLLDSLDEAALAGERR
jgi:hypothetical protein